MTLTKSDKTWVIDLLDDKLDKQEQKFEGKIDEFKNDFYNKIDPILKEVVASREERAMLSDHSSNQSDRIEVIEKKLNLQPAL